MDATFRSLTILFIISAVAPQSTIHRQPTEAIVRACSRTSYQSLCISSLVTFPGALTASDKDRIPISFNMTLHRLGRALYKLAGMSKYPMEPRLRSAYQLCVELVEDSADQLSQSLLSVAQHVGSSDDVLTWLSAALTDQDTCTEGLSEVENGFVKNQLEAKSKELSQLVTICLELYSAANEGDGYNGDPTQQRRRRFPKWLKRKDRKLLQTPAATIQADMVLAKDGNGTYSTIDRGGHREGAGIQ